MGFKLKSKKDRSRSKYLDLDFDSMSDEEFEKVSKKIKSEIAFRGLGGIFLFILAVVLLGSIQW